MGIDGQAEQAIVRLPVAAPVVVEQDAPQLLLVVGQMIDCAQQVIYRAAGQALQRKRLLAAQEVVFDLYFKYGLVDLTEVGAIPPDAEFFAVCYPHLIVLITLQLRGIEIDVVDLPVGIGFPKGGWMCM